MLVPRSSLQKPEPAIPKKAVISEAAPSTMAASTTWPRPEVRASSIAHTIP